MENLEKLTTNSLLAISQAKTREQVESLRVKLLGKKGEITTLMKGVGKLAPDERPKAGAAYNKVKVALESAIEKKLGIIQSAMMSQKLEGESFDITIPGRNFGAGKFHPVGMVMEELVEIFIGLGFEVAEEPEVETDEFNFKKLNFPDDHPARDMQDTFYVQNGARLLRTHTSPVQIHSMLKASPPLSVIAPGRVYRCDSDITHSPVFHQLEGFHVDKNVNFGHLKGTLELFLKRLYGSKTKTRLRPSFFPFTEPSAEVDVNCQMCGGDGCRVCKGTGWLEILGAGMIDPNVFEAVGYDPEVWSGFAFGFGIERIAMRKYAIDDIRLLFNNDTRFLSQF